MTHHDPTRRELSISPLEGHEHLFALGDAPDLDVFRRRLNRRLIAIGAPAVHETRRRGVDHPGDSLLFYTPTGAYIATAHPMTWEVAPHPLLTLELVRVTDAVWDAFATSEHLSNLADLTIKRSANADLATPGHLGFCNGHGLDALRRVTFEDCRWEPLRHLANKARLGTLEELTVTRSEIGLAWLRKLFGNPEFERVTRFTLETSSALSEEAARVCVHPEHHPKEWSPPYAAIKALSKAEVRAARRAWGRQ